MTEVSPIYEIIIKETDSMDSSSAHIVEGTSLEIRCMIEGNETKENMIKMMKDGMEVEGVDKRTIKTSYKIPSFSYSKHGGIYECSTVKEDKKYRSRLRIKHKAILPPDMIPCATDDNCSNGGVCGKIDESVSICICPEGYVGPRCEDVLIKDFVGTKLFTRTKMGVAAGGTCNVILIFITLLFALLYVRERKRRKHLDGVINNLPMESQSEIYPQLILKDPSYVKENEMKLIKGPMNEEEHDYVEHVNNGKNISRINAIRTRLIGTSSTDSQPHVS